jgi:putative hydrolase of the HAD superfamily
MTIKGVLFDFSGTLFRAESTESWLRAALREADLVLPEPELLRASGALEAVGALPGGSVRPVPPEGLEEAWHARDRSAEGHRAVFTAVSRQVPLPVPELHDALYERHMAPEAWHPYPDTAEVLAGLHAHGVPVGVVSNIGWDLRPVFRHHGVDRYVGAYTLSYEHGVQKPDPRLFALACDAIGVAPEDTLMVGDHPDADGGAAALGCAVRFVDHLPADRRPDGLRPVLELIRRAARSAR